MAFPGKSQSQWVPPLFSIMMRAVAMLGALLTVVLSCGDLSRGGIEDVWHLPSAMGASLGEWAAHFKRDWLTIALRAADDPPHTRTSALVANLRIELLALRGLGPTQPRHARLLRDSLAPRSHVARCIFETAWQNSAGTPVEGRGAEEGWDDPCEAVLAMQWAGGSALVCADHAPGGVAGGGAADDFRLDVERTGVAGASSGGGGQTCQMQVAQVAAAMISLHVSRVCLLPPLLCPLLAPRQGDVPAAARAWSAIAINRLMSPPMPGASDGRQEGVEPVGVAAGRAGLSGWPVVLRVHVMLTLSLVFVICTLSCVVALALVFVICTLSCVAGPSSDRPMDRSLYR